MVKELKYEGNEEWNINTFTFLWDSQWFICVMRLVYDTIPFTVTSPLYQVSYLHQFWKWFCPFSTLSSIFINFQMSNSIQFYENSTSPFLQNLKKIHWNIFFFFEDLQMKIEYETRSRLCSLQFEGPHRINDWNFTRKSCK